MKIRSMFRSMLCSKNRRNASVSRSSRANLFSQSDFFEGLEKRQLMAAFATAGSVVTLDLNVANQIMTVVSQGSSYTFTLSGGATNTWTGTAGSGLSASGTTLTANATALSTFNLFNITDSQSNTAVVFGTSGANAYSDSFNLTLDNTSNAVLFSGTSSFSASNNLTILADSRVELPSGSCLTMANGSLDMNINMQASPQVRNFSGLMVNNATIQTTGNGLTNIVARGGVGAFVSFLNKGVAVISGGKILGGTTGTMNITGYGYTGVDGVVQGQGVFVYNANTSASTSTISSIGANVSVTGYGANSTNSTLSGTGCMVNAGVVVGGPGTGGGTFCGTITSGGNATVTVTGYGGTLANQAASQNHYALGVYLNGLNATITSGGAGLVTVLGYGGGANANTACGMGVQVFCGTITSGTNGSVLVNGTGCTTASSSFNWGLWLQGTGAKIAAGAGTGSTTVIGTGGGCGTAGSNDGVCITSTGTITATGSGNVTVTGYGGTAGTGSTNRGINLSACGTITSNGGSVLVTGYGGGSGASANNYGVATSSNGTITAGGLGSVTVIGYGGNYNGTGGTNYGVNPDSGGSGQQPGKITSSGGNVVVTGTGGGGTANSPVASSSSTNIGVFVNQGGFITAGGSGKVNVTGYGGNRSPGATGATNYGVQLATANSTTANTAGFSCITSSGGAVNVTGFGGGGSGTDLRSTSATNHGVYVYQGGKISSGGNADVTVNGTGGGFGNSTTTGATNCGVVVCSTLAIANVGETFSTITSGGNGSVTINGQGGGSGTGANQWGVAVQAGGLVTSGGTGNVSITGVGGYTSGSNAFGVVVQCVTTSNVSSTVTSGGGNVVIHGTGGGNNSSTAYGVYVTVGAQVIAPGTASVTVTGRGGNANGITGQQHYGVAVSTACSTNRARAKITSNNGTVTVTGYGGNTNTTLTNACGSNYGVYMAVGGEISAGGTAPVTVIGYGGGLTQGATIENIGVCMTLLGTANLATQITSSGGAVTVSGYGGGTNSNHAGGLNFGVNIAGGGQISTTGSGTSVNITGTGGGGESLATNYGIQIQGCSTLSNVTITTNGGPITLNATEGNGSSTRGIITTGSVVIGNVTNPGNITILTNSAGLSSTTGSAINAAGSLLIAPITPGVGVRLGAVTDSLGGPLNLSSAELNTMSAGTIQLGNNSTGNFTLITHITVPAASNLTLVSNSTASTGILSQGSITMGAGKQLNISALPSVNTLIDGTTAQTQYSQLSVAGNLSIAGKSLNLSGSYTSTGGDVFTIANATNLTGTFTGLADGSTTTLNGRTLLVNYTPTTATLTDPAPNVITQPTGNTVTSGSTVSFTANATGIPAPSVQWQVLAPGGGSVWSNITNATSPTYSFSTATGDNGNQYRAFFTNTYGDATTSAVSLSVQFAPSITTQPTAATINDGQTATFTAAATGNPTPTVQWQANTGSGWADVTDGTGSTTDSYTTVALTSAETGYQYRALYTNSITANVATNGATVTVNSGSIAPIVTGQPATIGREVGQTASFTASASGSPAPTVQWQVKIGAANWADITNATAATYSFSAALSDQGNQYQAVFTNTAGTATTNPATLDIGVTPVFTSINYMTIPVGLTSGITVIATGVPAPQYTIVSGSLPSGVTLDPVTGLFAGAPAGGTAGSYPVTIQALNGIGTAPTQNFSLTVTSTVTSFVVSRGAAQRSYVRYLDLGMDSNASALTLLNNPSRVQLTKANLNGVGSAPVPLAGLLSVPSGQSTLAVNFGTIGLGNSRNTSTADGYYTLGVDLDGNGTFETNLFFFRLFGDTNGDREVTATDQSAVLAGCTAAYNANLDLNGDGVVNTSDLNYVKRNVGRKLKNTLIVTS